MSKVITEWRKEVYTILVLIKIYPKSLLLLSRQDNSDNSNSFLLFFGFESELL